MCAERPLTSTMASSSNSSERKWKLGLLFYVALILGVRFKTNPSPRVKWPSWDITGVNITVGDVLYSESSGNLAGGRDGTAKSRPSSSWLKRTDCPLGTLHQGVVKILRERGNAITDPSGDDSYTLPSLATRPTRRSMLRLPKPRSFSHETPPNVEVAQQIPVPLVSAQEGVELGSISQDGIISSARNETSDVFPLYPSAPSSNQSEAPPSASALPPLPASDNAPHPPTSKPPGPLKRCLRAIRKGLHRSKRKKLPPS